MRTLHSERLCEGGKEENENGPVVVEKVLENELLDEGVSELEADLEEGDRELDVVAFYKDQWGPEWKPFMACL